MVLIFFVRIELSCVTESLNRMQHSERPLGILVDIETKISLISFYLPQVLSVRDRPAHENLLKPCKTILIGSLNVNRRNVTDRRLF
jgi:hypothetical protein